MQAKYILYFLYLMQWRQALYCSIFQNVDELIQEIFGDGSPSDSEDDNDGDEEEDANDIQSERVDEQQQLSQ